MYIAPNSTVKFLKGVPLDTTFDHTLYFATETAQQSYFNSKVKANQYDPATETTYSFTINNQTYQRYADGVMRVQIPADCLYDCNYMMFKNITYGSKWFYAYINKVEYVNNITANVHYIIDVMQTWYFDYTLEDSFVEREHSSSDIVGENTIPENLEQGEYVQMGSATLINDEDSGAEPHQPPAALIISTINISDYVSPTIRTYIESAKGYINGVYSSLYYNYVSRAEIVGTIIEELEETEPPIDVTNAIVSISLCPCGMELEPCLYAQPRDDDEEIGNRSYYIKQYDKKISGGLGENQDYVPRNKKLYTAPFNILHVETGSNCADFNYELFTGNKCTFVLRYALLPSPAYTLIPRNYKTTNNSENMEARITINDYPMMPFTNDVYKVYLAQNQSQITTKMIGTGVRTFVGVASGISKIFNPLTWFNKSNTELGSQGGGIQAANSLIDGALEIGQELARQKDLERQPPQVNGTQPTTADYGMGVAWFRLRRYSAKKEYLQIIDSFFDMFGYATNRVKIPNTHVRKHWTYTKTTNCVATGSVPSDDLDFICKIYNHGITFWTNPAEVGKYTQYASDNTPL